MAALIARDKLVLLSNGKDIGFSKLCSPNIFHRIEVPCLAPVSRGDQGQATLLPKSKSQVPSENASTIADGAATVPTQGTGDADLKLPEGDGQAAHPSADESTQDVNGTKKERLESPEPNYIRAVSVSHNGHLIAVCDDRKYLHMYRLGTDESCHILSSRCTARRCTSICFSPDDGLVLVADKSGDVYSFLAETQGGQSSEVIEESETKSNNAVLGDDDEEENVGEGKLVLGHLSMLLGVHLVDNARLVVTCDRDEKVRISRFPRAHNIEAYCLGHTEFVNCLAFDEDEKVLLSASGDCTVRVWNLDGVELCKADVTHHLPKGISNVSSDASSAETVKVDQHQAKNSFRPSIKQITYCRQCKLIFVAMERCSRVIVYRLEIKSTDKPSRAGNNLTFVTSLNTEDPELDFTSMGDGVSQRATQDTSSCTTGVVSLCISGCVLWVLTQTGGRLQLAAYSVCLDDQQNVQISAVTKDSREALAVQTISTETDFMTAHEECEDLLPFLWKSSFQDDFKRDCNIKRATPEGEGKKSNPGGKKAKVPEKNVEKS